MFGERLPRTIPTPPAPFDAHADDSPHATYMLANGYPTACPTCGSRTRPAADIPEGWLCSHPACTFSTRPQEPRVILN